MSIAGWLFDVLGVKDLYDALGTLYPRRQLWRILGASIADNPTLGTTDITIGGVSFWWTQQAAPAIAASRWPNIVPYSGYGSSQIGGQYLVTRPFIATAATFVCESVALATDTVVVTVQKNGTDTAMTFTIPAGTTPGTVISDYAHAVAFAQGDKIGLKFFQSGATAQANWFGLFQVG